MDNRNRHPNYRRIARDFDALVDGACFDVIVIGSGYGGSIAASRMARIGKSVCLLERGREFLPGEFPAGLTSAQSEMQIRTDSRSEVLGKRNGLYDLRVNEDVSVILGCGLGGTSLINANVSLTADPDVLLSSSRPWPRVLKDRNAWLPYYKKARHWLNAAPYPDGYPMPNKLAALEKAAHGLGMTAYRPPINVTFEDFKDNGHGVPQPKCNRCGDCCSGCNHGSKNTTLMNYLPDAHKHGAQLFCNCTVNFIAPGDGSAQRRWRVNASDTMNPDPTITVFADTLFVCAGTFGSTEIMLRSKRRGLSCSDRLGKNFSGNGDVLAFGFNSYWRDNDATTDPRLQPDGAQRFEPVYGIGQADNRIDDKALPGPCITGVVDLRSRSRQVIDRCVIEEGVIPGPFGAILPMTFFMVAAHRAHLLEYGAAQAEFRLKDMQDLSEAMAGIGGGMSAACYRGALARTQSYLGMGVDGADGELRLMGDEGQLVVHWPGAGDAENARKLNATISRLNDQVQGHFLPNPLWDKSFGRKLATVHPLGGCSMADDAGSGVVNDACAVFSGATGDAVHAGLYVCDGSVLPGAIGVNPLLTISAIAERACELIYGKEIPTDFTPIPGDPYTEAAPLLMAAKSVPAAESSDNAVRALHEFGQRLVQQTESEAPTSEHSSDARLSSSHWFKDTILPMAALGSITAMAGGVTQDRKQDRADIMSEEERRLWNLQYRAVDDLLAVRGERFTQWMTFSETMSGHVAEATSIERSDRLDGRFKLARQRGQSEGVDNALQLTACIRVEDIESAVDSHTYKFAIASGSRVRCDRYWGGEVEVADGDFYLLRNDPDTVDTWTLNYSVRLCARHNEPKFLYGFKTLHGEPHSHWWTDLTTLCVAIYDNEADFAAKKPPRAIGEISLSLQEFLHQLTSFDYRTKSSFVTWMIRIMSFMAGQDPQTVQKMIAQYFGSKLAADLGMIIFRAYGGLLATLKNFPADDLKTRTPPAQRLPDPMVAPQLPGEKFRLTHYAGKGVPVILGPGMGVNASSFATTTVEKNLVEALREKGRDVWLFDYRASFDSGFSQEPFTLDDIAEEDWPRAIDRVREISGASQVQIVAHCVSSLTLLMSLLAGYTEPNKIRSIVSSQLTLHPVANWSNNAKADSEVIDALEALPLMEALGSVVSMNSGQTPFDHALDVFAAQIPVPEGEECNNPTCRRIFAIYGPSYRHAQLNQATHTALSTWFKGIHLQPFRQMAKLMQCGVAVDASGRNRYLTRSHVKEGVNGNAIAGLDRPITFIAGAMNLEFLPETSERTYDWLCAHNPIRKPDYRRRVFPDYGHMDFFIGKRAHLDIFPFILLELDRYLDRQFDR